MNVTLVRPWVSRERPRGTHTSKRRSKPGQPSTEGVNLTGGNNKPAWPPRSVQEADFSPTCHNQHRTQQSTASALRDVRPPRLTHAGGHPTILQPTTNHHHNNRGPRGGRRAQRRCNERARASQGRSARPLLSPRIKFDSQRGSNPRAIETLSNPATWPTYGRSPAACARAERARGCCSSSAVR